MRALIILLVLTAGAAFGLPKDEILRLSKLPHSRENISKEIAFFPDVRVYEVRQTIEHPKNVPNDDRPTIVRDKVVEGKYVVSQYKLRGGPLVFDVIQVTSYSKENMCYKQWSYNKQLNLIYEYRGVRLGETNQISWHSVRPIPKQAPQTVVVNAYHKDRIDWIHQDYLDGKLVFAVSAVAKKVVEDDAAKP